MYDKRCRNFVDATPVQRKMCCHTQIRPISDGCKNSI